MPVARRSKYRAVRTAYNGRTYDSKAEAARAQELDMMRDTGAILYWQPQVTFVLGDDTLRVDFLVWHEDGKVEAEDVKGYETRGFKRKAKLWQKYAPCPLRVLRRRGRAWEARVVPPCSAPAVGGSERFIRGCS